MFLMLIKMQVKDVVKILLLAFIKNSEAQFIDKLGFSLYNWQLGFKLIENTALFT
jgi:hypothetical protein